MICTLKAIRSHVGMYLAIKLPPLNWRTRWDRTSAWFKNSLFPSSSGGVRIPRRRVCFSHGWMVTASSGGWSCLDNLSLISCTKSNVCVVGEVSTCKFAEHMTGLCLVRISYWRTFSFFISFCWNIGTLRGDRQLAYWGTFSSGVVGNYSRPYLMSLETFWLSGVNALIQFSTYVGL